MKESKRITNLPKPIMMEPSKIYNVVSTTKQVFQHQENIARRAHMDEVLKGNKIGKDGEEAVEGSNFSLLIKHYRRLRNYSLKDLEAISGISSSYIFRLESSKRNSPSINKVIALAKGLRIPSAVLVATLLHGLEEGERLSSLPEVLIQNNFFLGSGMLSSEGKGYLIRIVEHIDRAEWSPQTKMRELYQLSELIDEFKEAIN